MRGSDYVVSLYHSSVLCYSFKRSETSCRTNYKENHIFEKTNTDTYRHMKIEIFYSSTSTLYLHPNSDVSPLISPIPRFVSSLIGRLHRIVLASVARVILFLPLY